MTDHVPTVDELLADTALGNGLHCWAIEGGRIEITTNNLRHALEEVYDPTFPNWTAFVDVDDLA